MTDQATDAPAERIETHEVERTAEPDRVSERETTTVEETEPDKEPDKDTKDAHAPDTA